MPNLSFADCLYRTYIGTGAAINALIRINNVKFRSFADCLYSTLGQAGAAAGAKRTIDLKRHSTSPPFSQCRLYNNKTSSFCQQRQKGEILAHDDSLITLPSQLFCEPSSVSLGAESTSLHPMEGRFRNDYRFVAIFL